jgi:16S rRNA (cytosine967-C5)-methyltransferase
LEGSATLTTLKVNEGEKIWLQKILLTGAFRLEDYQLENCPSWCLPLFQETFGSRAKEEVAALHQPAPVDLRINPFKIARPEALALLTSEGFPVTKTPYSPWGLRLGAGVRLRADHPLLKKGQLEFQEEGSQLVALSLPVSPGMTIVDYCAGAGGKTLVLAHRLHHKGVLYATDTVSTRLKRARLRLRRAGVSNVRLVDLSQNVCWRKRHQQQVDLVLVDAPCSGSGTWRRNPDAKWRLTPQDLQELQQKQQEILDQAATLVRPGGILAYATCSLWHIENTHQISIFLGQHKNFISQDITAPWIQRSLSSFPFLLLTPAQHHTDGFFLALLRRQNALS